jgi:hypothetical protein
MLQTAHRFRTKRQLDLQRVGHRGSADHPGVKGQLERKKKHIEIRGLNKNYHHPRKNLFNSAAVVASTKPGPFEERFWHSHCLSANLDTTNFTS